MKKTFFIHTTGCKANQWDGSVIAGNFTRQGYIPSSVDRAQFVMINACTVTEGAVRDIRRFINRVKRENPGARIIIAGCHGQVYPEESFGADIVLGQSEKFLAHDYTGLKGTFVSSRDLLTLEGTPRDLDVEGKTRFFLKIQDGCDRFCNYCIVPYARGGPRSRPLNEILDTMKALKNAGIQEVVLTGIEISAWRGLDGTGFTDLLQYLDNAPTPARIRLSSVDPLMFTEAFIDAVARSPKIARSFHIPLQSGCDAVLAAMGRLYSRSDIEKMLDRLKQAVPDAGIGMDVIVGFPGENEGFFAQTRSFLESVGIYYLHVFPFSPRPGTKAMDMTGKIPETIKKQRVRELKALDSQFREDFYRRFVGSRAKVIPESKQYSGGYMRGYTDNYIPVYIPFDKTLVNTLLTVTIGRIENGNVFGEI
ncbi:MAG: tRNA (N(6)-L-threonylcarbamoyladenosine(37)-C(2))-methylthiotransferase MtaB [Syntrophorhabdaceae bacterium]